MINDRYSGHPHFVDKAPGKGLGGRIAPEARS